MTSEFQVDAGAGLVSPARQVPSPNFDSRPPGMAPEIIVLHGISLPPGHFGGGEIEALFTNTLDWEAHPYFDEIRGLEVSTHLLIRRDAEVLQFVPLTQRAWHCGMSFYRGRHRCNDFAIGIELEGEDETAYENCQYDALVSAIAAIRRAWPAIGNRHIVAHSDIAPGRKTDPGPAFDWLRLYDGLP